MKKVYQPLYDKVYVDRKSIAVKFFQTPLGGIPKPGRLAKDANPAPRTPKPLNQLDTLMDMGGQLPHPKMFYVDGISLVTDTEEEIEEYIRRSWVRFHIAPVDHLVLPLKYLHQDVMDFDINEPVFEWPEPVIIPPQTNFYVEVLTPKPTNQGRFHMECVLEGSWSRWDPNAKEILAKLEAKPEG